MLALPADTGLGRQGFFEHRCAVGEHAVTHVTEVFDYALGEALQAFAHQLVIIAPKSIAGNVGKILVIQQHHRISLFVNHVVQAHADNGQGMRHQLRRMQALVDVTRHILHFAVIVALDPAAVVQMMRIQFDIGDAHILETEFASDSFDDLGLGQLFINQARGFN